MGYYWKILELEGIKQNTHRFYKIIPDKFDRYPSHFSLSQVLYYSDSTIKEIKNIVKNKCAYIVPGYINKEDMKVAVKLNIPIFSGDSSKNMLFSSKSGAKRIINISEIPTSPCE